MASQVETVVVSCTGEDKTLRTLAGEYVEVGSNDGRKTYRKTHQIKVVDQYYDVFIYYWDDKEAEEWKGWWFGDQVGGLQVWSFQKSDAMKPPQEGWQVPFDGPVRSELNVLVNPKVEPTGVTKVPPPQPKASVQSSVRPAPQAKWESTKVEPEVVEVDDEMEDAKARAAALDARYKRRVAQATARVSNVEEHLKKALAALGELLPTDGQAVMQARKQLLVHQQKLTEVQKFVSAENLAAKTAPMMVRQGLESLIRKLRALQAEVKQALLGLPSPVKAETVPTPAYTPMEHEHLQQLEEMMPSVLEKIDQAEDEVEKVTIAAAPLQVESGEELRPVMLQAIKDTEKAMRSGQNAIQEARRFISGKLSHVGRFAPLVKKQAIDEFSSLQERLNAAQKRLNPFKSVRQDYERRAQARKLYEELSSKLAGAEIEVEKAAMMTAPMGTDSDEGMKETEATLTLAQTMLAQTNRQVEAKLKQLEDVDFGEQLKGLLERCKLAQEKLDDLRSILRETQVRLAADLLMKEVSDKVANAEDEIQKMAEAELPFLRNDKDQDMSELFAEADKVAAHVHGVLAETQSYVARKSVEVSKFSDGPGEAVKEEVENLQRRLEEGRERLQQFRISIADRKRTRLLEEVTFKILAAEQEVKKMGDVATPLPGMGQPGEKLAEFFYETLQEASQSDKVAQASVAAARKLLLHKTAELKKLAMAGGDRSGSGGELGRLQTRVNSMQQEIAKFRSNISNAEERFRVKEQLVEVMDKLQMVEGEVEKVAANDIPEQEYSPELVQEADKANTSVKMKLEQLAKLLEIKQRSAGGVLLEELTAMQQRNKKAEKKLERVMQAATERKQQLQASEMVGQSLEQVERSELELQKAVQADWPFQSSFEDAPLQTMQTALAESEAACLQTQKAISEARGLILEHLAKAKDFQGVVQDFCSKELVVLQKRLDQMASKLGELKKEGTERKRKVQLRSTAEKISEVEASVQQLTSLVQRLGQEASSSLSKAQAQERCEEGYALEETAKKLVDGAKRFLTQREAEAKTLAETHRLPFMTDLAKLRSRLTTAQVNLSKLSKELTEYEHGYVAKQLAQDVSSELTRLNKETEVALQACSALLEEEGHRKVLQALRQDALVEALQEELKSQSIEDLWAGLSNGPSVSEEDFRVWLQTRLEARPFSTPITEEQIRDVWPLLTNSAEPGSASAGRPGLSEATLKELLRERRHVTGAAAQLWDAPEGGEELGQLYEGEGLEVLEANSGERLQGRLLRDSRTFWVPSSALSASTGATKLQSLVAYIKAITANCDFSAKQTQQKGAQVITLKTGPLVAVGNQLLEASKKFMEEKDKLEALKEKLTLAKDAAVREHEAEVKELESAKCQAFAEKSLAKAKGEVQQANHAVQEVGSKDLSPEQVQELPPSELEALLKKSEGAEEALNTAKATIEEVRLSFEGFKGPKKLMLQVRVELERLKKVLKVSQQAWEGNHQQISTTCAQVRKRLKMRARQALRMCFRQAELSAESAFQQVARRDPKRVSHQEFLRFVENLPDAHGTKVSSEQAELIFQDFETSGMEKVHFFKAVQEYAVCIKEISMTSDFHIQISDRLRKLLAQEVVEIFEGPRDDEEAAVQRVRCRALKDGQVGWVTTKGNQGTAFLKPREKPVLQVLREADLREMMPLDAAKLGQLQVDEKLELLEGPREETFQPQIFLQSDDGFVSLEALEATGTTCSTKHFVCRATIAMTDVHDISDCKVLGKIHVGELLEAVDEPEPPLVDDEAAPATTSGRVTQPSSTSSGSKTLPRRRFRSKTLEKEGWVTLQGNAGTVYLEQSVQHFVLCGPVPLLSSPNKDGLLKRMLEEGELLAVKQKVTKTIPPQVMMQVRSLDDARRSGWLSFVAGPDAPVKPWVERSSAG